MSMSSMHTISILGDSPRQASGQVVDEGSQRTQASSVMQMWRNIEDVHTGRHAEQRTKVLRHQSDEFNDDISTQTSESNCSEQRIYLEEMEENIGCSNLSGSQARLKAGDQYGREKSPAIGETERERVRQIFRDWMKCGGREHSSNRPQMSGSSRAQWLADNEGERVRVVREWVQLTSQDKGSNSGKKEVTETRSEIEKVRDGLVVNQNEGRPNRVHRKFRKLCGKQALLDLLAKAEKERQDELQDLIKHHAVSRFPHRNRIQALLKGRFLRNNVSSEKQQPRSTAAGELGLLRQRQTVSGLREGFLSRTESCGQSQLGSTNDNIPISSDTIANGTQKTDINTKEEMTVKIYERDDSTKEDHNSPGSRSVLIDSQQARLASVRSVDVVNELEIHNNDVSRQQSVGAELTVSSSDTVADESLQEKNTNERSQRQEQHDGEVFAYKTHDVNALSCGPSDTIYQGSGICETSACMNDGSCVNLDDLDSQRHATVDEQLPELHFGIDIGRMDRVAYNDWSTLSNGMVDDSPMGNARGQSFDAPEHASLLSDRHDRWSASDSEESVEYLLQRNSRQTSGAFFASSDTIYGSEDNVRTSELNELVVRRTVSNLLESDFRVSLNRLLQTYVERQAHALMGWDLNDSMSPPASELLHQEQQSDNLNENSVHTFAPFSRSGRTTPHIRHEQNWDQVPWTHTVHQPLGFQDWEVISDLRMDITSLQLRMNDMQRMLEACMDMQLELQRSIRQEVSAALNRSVSPASVDRDVADEKSKWELVRKGVCCICSQSSIDSLLYRCGHMCTCTECANKLFDEKSKCPMCRSPIVEVIRAYSVQQ